MPQFSKNGHTQKTRLRFLGGHTIDPDLDCDYEAPDDNDQQNIEAPGWDRVEELVRGIRWLVPGWVPFGMLTGIIAQPKAGKSGFALGALVAPVIMGGRWFNCMPGPEPGYAVYCDTERSAAINIQRAKRWGLPLDRIKVPFADDPLKPINLEDRSHMDRIKSVVRRYKAPLVVVDSFRGAHDGDENNSKIVKPLRGLGEIAEETGTAVVLIHHTKKVEMDADLTINAGRGSNAFLAAVRCQIAIDQPDNKSDYRRLQVLGENLGIKPTPIGFRLTESGIEYGGVPARPKEDSQTDKAVDWLRQRMQPGEVYNSGDLMSEATDAGYAERTVRRATQMLGVERRPLREGGHIVAWEWLLPALPGGNSGGI